MNVKVAPFESCIACYRGDTTTVVVIEGEAEFHIAATHKLAGIPLDQAPGTFAVFAERNLGCDPGSVPVGRFAAGFRLCRDCAQKTGASVVEQSVFDSGVAPGYRQLPGEEGGGA